MVRTFLVALRASFGSLARVDGDCCVDLCQLGSLSDFAVFERSRSCQKRDRVLRPLQKIVLRPCNVNSLYFYLVLPDENAEASVQ